jgi:glycosyltransferase involved in cell wall biosynthesis
MNNKLKVVLIGNYKKDKQESMSRFLTMLKIGLDEKSIANEVWLPICFFGCLVNNTKKGIGKWISYLDKYFLTSLLWYIKTTINSRKNQNTVYHICDHSNAIYQGLFPNNKTLITCHDVIAIRGALGYKDAYCNSTYTGKILQKTILNQLERIKHIAFVSNNTYQQFLEISTHISFDKLIIKNGQNYNYTHISSTDLDSIQKKQNKLPNGPFFLHVGSNLERKNRKLLVEILHNLGDAYQGKICFAGKAPDIKLWEIIKKYHLENRIHIFENPSNQELNLLYNLCDAFIFPSYSEGFGWPIIEAQACGAPVICSAMEPFFEIAGTGALYGNNLSPKSFVDEFLKLKKQEFKNNLIQLALSNAQQYDSKSMIQKYLEVYQNLN